MLKLPHILLFVLQLQCCHVLSLQEGKLLIFLILLAQKGYWVFLETYEVETFALLKIINLRLLRFFAWRDLLILHIAYSSTSLFHNVICDDDTM